MCPTNVSVIILTFNEEKNIAQCINSVMDWASRVFVLDSFSEDHTSLIASNLGCVVLQNKFVNFSEQRNFALDNFPIETDWILFLDADEWMPEPIKSEITSVLQSHCVYNGFYIKRKLVWMDRWIKRGYYPSWQLRLFRKGFGRCEARPVNEHFIVQGSVGFLDNDFVDQNHNGLQAWLRKHIDYAEKEARQLYFERHVGDNEGVLINFFGSQSERRRWLRKRIWNKLPLMIRPFLYFLYRYILLGGFRDGVVGFAFHFLQALWYPMLIDIKYLEIKKGAARSADF